MSTPGKRRRKDPGQRGFFERIMFSFMGPPQLGDLTAPSSVPVDPAAALCHKCGQPWERHERVATGSTTYLRCPEAQE